MAPEITILQDRLQVAHLLAEKLLAYKNSNAVIVAVPKGGVPIGFALADLLNLPMEIVACKKIKHPAHGNKSMGAVSIDDLVVKDDLRSVPQDYIYHQVILLQHILKAKCDYYRRNNSIISLAQRTVILVDDVVQTGDTVLACLKSIKKQTPQKIILATSITTPEAVQVILKEVDELFALQIENGNHLHGKFDHVSDEDVRDIFDNIRCHVPIS